MPTPSVEAVVELNDVQRVDLRGVGCGICALGVQVKAPGSQAPVAFAFVTCTSLDVWQVEGFALRMVERCRTRMILH